MSGISDSSLFLWPVDSCAPRDRVEANPVCMVNFDRLDLKRTRLRFLAGFPFLYNEKKIFLPLLVREHSFLRTAAAIVLTEADKRWLLVAASARTRRERRAYVEKVKYGGRRRNQHQRATRRKRLSVDLD